MLAEIVAIRKVEAGRRAAAEPENSLLVHDGDKDQRVGVQHGIAQQPVQIEPGPFLLVLVAHEEHQLVDRLDLADGLLLQRDRQVLRQAFGAFRVFALLIADSLGDHEPCAEHRREADQRHEGHPADKATLGALEEPDHGRHSTSQGYSTIDPCQECMAIPLGIRLPLTPPHNRLDPRQDGRHANRQAGVMNRSRLPLFATLRALREFERRHLPFLQTLEDCDLVREIGYRQAAGRPITLKELMLLGLGSVPTTQRRLRRLRQLKVVVQYRCVTDRRAVELVLSPKVVKTIGLCEDLLRPAGSADAPYRGAASAPGAAPALRTAARRKGTAPAPGTGAPAAPGEPRDALSVSGLPLAW